MSEPSAGEARTRPPRPGSLDRSFAVEPPPDSAVLQIVPAGDGYLLGGSFGHVGGQRRKNVAHVGRSGGLTASFDTSQNPFGANQVLSYGNGALLVEGTGIHRLRGDGSVDEDFEQNRLAAGVSGSGDAAYKLPNGNILMACSLRPPADPTGPALLILRPDGTVERTIARYEGEVNAIAVPNDDEIVLAGHELSFDGSPESHLVRLDADGNLDPAFPAGGGPDRGVWTMTTVLGGGFLIVGPFDRVAGQPRSDLAILAPDGSPTNFEARPAPGSVRTVAMQTGGRVLVGGYLSQQIGRRGVARYHSDGRLDTTLEARFTGQADVHDMVLSHNFSRLVIGGNFENVDGVERRAVARLHVPLATDPTDTGQVESPGEVEAAGPRGREPGED